MKEIKCSKCGCIVPQESDVCPKCGAQLTDEQKTEAEALYQVHGDHIGAIMDAEEFMKKHLPTMIQDGVMHKKVETTCVMDDGVAERTNVFALLYGKGDIQTLALIVYSKRRNTNEFVSVYPYMKGKLHEVVIEKVLEWSNGVEATIKVSIGDHDCAFFATDYYCNKERYTAGRKAVVELSALGINVQEGHKGFDFQGQEVLDFLAKIGEQPELDEDGSVKPLHFSMEQTVMCIATDEKCPDEAEFQSPVEEVAYCSVAGVPFVRCGINITDPDEPCMVPLYFRKDFLPDVSQGQSVSGWLWLTGQMA